MQYSRAFTSLAAILSAVLGTGCATTSPGVAYYDMNRTDSPRPKDGVNDVFALDKAILKFSFPEGAKAALDENATTKGIPGTEPAKGQAGTTPSSNAGALPDWKKNPSPLNPRVPGIVAKQPASGESSGTRNQQEAPKTPEAPKQVKVTVELVESDQRIGFAGVNDFRKTTTFNIVKRTDSELIESAGATTTANLQTSINKVGTLLTGLAGVLKTVKDDKECQSFGEPVITAANRTAQKGQAGNCATYELGPIPADAIPVQDIPWGKEVPTFYYAACRTLKVTITAQGAGRVEPFMFKIPDPNFVQAVRIPFKGSITKHKTCGVSTVTEAQASPTASIEALTELVTQLNAYQAAKDEKKDGK